MDETIIRTMENHLANDPHRGVVIPGANGARKMRLALPGRGKSGSARVIYVYVEVKGRIYCLLVYRKNVQENLTPEQNRALSAIIEALKGEP
ncbi:MAG: type II toxin-antitoxin system RelE/ParE family toxin [Chloroflexota bacterium]|nr:type II toxin-antitoxin system RelE/ParE family toxin [Chloroflexota bacterium]